MKILRVKTENIRKIMGNKNISLYKLEKETGTSANNIKNWMYNKTKNCNYEVVGRICTVLEIDDMNDILEITPKE
ncbi:helix-turn-helix domain-containing protein [Inediibacterium massiliense]|uniref:helix-turn-helix domain-containing protein n=1 Tax=Inediibacterium massiliense TaxID=1658111 RepID=UPI0006B4F653|nr:helix-turn-helix transcriptional regulator [Inediibacterium massiliense]